MRSEENVSYKRSMLLIRSVITDILNSSGIDVHSRLAQSASISGSTSFFPGILGEPIPKTVAGRKILRKFRIESNESRSKTILSVEDSFYSIAPYTV